MILLELNKQKLVNMADVDQMRIKDILKKLNLNKLYEHVPHIFHKLTNLPVPNFSPEFEEQLRNMFKITQPLFLKYAPPTRKNFLSYSYSIHKFIQLLGKNEYLKHFPLLKSRQKLHEQDIIFKKICSEIGWPFYPSC